MLYIKQIYKILFKTVLPNPLYFSRNPLKLFTAKRFCSRCVGNTEICNLACASFLTTKFASNKFVKGFLLHIILVNSRHVLY